MAGRLSSPSSASAIDDGSASQRAEILEATLRVLGARGPHGLKVRAIADEAGCSTTGVYTWFGNKNGLIEAVWLDSFLRFGDALRRAWARARGSKLNGLRRGLTAYRDWALANRERYVVMFATAFPEFEPSTAAVGQALGSFLILVEAVADCQAEGSVMAGDPTLLANHLWAAIHGYVMLELSMDGGHGPFDAGNYGRGVELLLAGIR